MRVAAARFATAQSMGGEQRAPMAVAVIGGLITSTVLTLVVIPVVYSLFSRTRRAEQPTGVTAERPPSRDHAMAHPAA
jgi:hypothetical protein